MNIKQGLFQAVSKTKSNFVKELIKKAVSDFSKTASYIVKFVFRNTWKWTAVKSCRFEASK